MKSGLRAVAPHGAGSGGIVKSTLPAVSARSVGHTRGAVPTSNVDPAHPAAEASSKPGVASQSSSRPGHTTNREQPICRPCSVVTLGPSGSTATTRSSIQVHPSGTTEAAGRSRSSIDASPAPT